MLGGSSERSRFVSNGVCRFAPFFFVILMPNIEDREISLRIALRRVSSLRIIDYYQHIISNARIQCLRSRASRPCISHLGSVLLVRQPLNLEKPVMVRQSVLFVFARSNIRRADLPTHQGAEVLNNSTTRRFHKNTSGAFVLYIKWDVSVNSEVREFPLVTDGCGD